MKTKRTKQVLAWLMTLVISLATLAPATIVVGADANGSDVIYSNDFSNSADAPISGVGGTTLFGYENVATAAVDGGTLKITSNDKACLTLRPYQNSALATTVYNRSLVLSFKLKTSEKIALGAFYCDDGSVGSDDFVLMNLKSDGAIYDNVNKKAYGNIVVGEWNEFEIVFHYNDATGKYVSYTIVHNGTNLATFDFTAAFSKIDSFRLGRYATTGKTYELDDLCFGFDQSTVLYNVDFTEESFGNAAPLGGSGIKEYLRVMDKYNADKTYLKNDILTMTKNVDDATNTKVYFDAYFVGSNTEKYLYGRDVTFSMRFRPGSNSETTDFMTVAGINASGSTKGTKMLSYKSGAISIIGTSFKKAIPSHGFTTLDMMLHYDYASACYTSADVYVNGESVGTFAITAGDCTKIAYFRVWQCYADNGTLDLDSVSIATGMNTTNKNVAVTEFVGYQATAANADAKTFNLRLLAITTDEDLSKYENVGFKVTATYGSTTMTLPEELGVCTAVYSSVSASAGIDATYTAKDLGGSAIFALNCLNVPTDGGAITFTVTTYYTVAGEDSVEEKTFTFTVDPANDIPKGGVN